MCPLNFRYTTAYQSYQRQDYPLLPFVAKQKQNKAKQNKAKQNIAKQNKTKRNKTKATKRNNK